MNKTHITHGCLILATLMLTFSARGAQEAKSRTSVGMRLGAAGAQQNALEDIVTFSCYVQRQLSAHCFLELSLDSSVFEFEVPAQVLSPSLTTEGGTEDTSGKASVLSISSEYTFREEDVRIIPYLRGGLGVGFADIEEPEEDAAGNTRYEFEVDADDHPELAATLSAGLRITPPRSRWLFELGCRYEHHFVEWKIIERTSGRRATIDEYQSFGAFLGISTSI